MGFYRPRVRVVEAVRIEKSEAGLAALRHLVRPDGTVQTDKHNAKSVTVRFEKSSCMMHVGDWAVRQGDEVAGYVDEDFHDKFESLLPVSQF